MTEPPRTPVSVLIGGVSELYQHDLDLGRLAVERLAVSVVGPGVLVEELHYGAVAVAQRLEDLRPATLILISAVVRGRSPGSVLRRVLDPPVLSTADVQAAVGDAVTGYVHPDLVIEIAAALGCLPPRVVLVEVEPEVTGSGEGLSASATVGLGIAVDLAKAEARRAPLLGLAADLRPTLDRLDESAAVRTLRRLLADLERLDRDGDWGHAFALRDRLRQDIAGTPGSEGMQALDWGLWWALIEEMDRLQAAEAAAS